MDENYLMAAARYIERNPVRAHLSRCVWHYRWSSARAHVNGKDDRLVRVKPLLARVDDWKEFVRVHETDVECEALRQHERTGRPLGSNRFMTKMERIAGRLLRKQKPGPKTHGK